MPTKSVSPPSGAVSDRVSGVGTIVIDTVAMLLSSWKSLAWKVNESAPVAPGAGV